MSERFLPQESLQIIEPAILEIQRKITWKSDGRQNKPMLKLIADAKALTLKVRQGEQVSVEDLCKLLERFEILKAEKFVRADNTAHVNKIITVAQEKIQALVPEISDENEESVAEDLNFIDGDDNEVEETATDNGGSRALNLFFKEMSRYKLLSAAEERELGEKIYPYSEDFVDLEDEIAELQAALEECNEEEINALEERLEIATLRRDRIYRAASEPLNALVNANLRLVVKFAKGNRSFALPLLEKIQAGSLGLREAGIRFNPRLGYRFSTYAGWWIKQAITREDANSSRRIRIPVHLGEKMDKMQRAQKKLRALIDGYSSDEEIAVVMNDEEALRVEANEALLAEWLVLHPQLQNDARKPVKKKFSNPKVLGKICELRKIRHAEAKQAALDSLIGRLGNRSYDQLTIQKEVDRLYLELVRTKAIELGKSSQNEPAIDENPAGTKKVKFTGESVKFLRETYYAGKEKSTDETFDPEDSKSGTLMDTPVSGTHIAVDDQMEIVDLREILEGPLSQLPAPERSVIEAYFGLDGKGGKTHKEIGDGVDLTRSRIQQLKAQAIVRLRAAFAPEDGESLNEALERISNTTMV